MKLTAISLLAILFPGIPGCADHEQSDYDTLRPTDAFSLTIDPDSVLADGVTSPHVIVELVDPESSSQQVTISALGAYFLGTESASRTLTTDQFGRAEAALSPASREIQILVRAKIRNMELSDVVTYIHAYPTSLLVDPGTFVLKAGATETTSVSVYLYRRKGTPTAGTPVDFQALDSSGMDFGKFRAQTPSDASGKATAIFTTADSLYRGEVTIVATVGTDRGPLSATGTLEVIDP